MASSFPHLTVCDFFLWGYLKHQIWSQPQNVLPEHIRNLKIAIQNAVNNLGPIMLRRAFQGMVHRIQKCIQVNGYIFPDG